MRNTPPSPITHVACNSNLCVDPINLLALLLSVEHSQLTQPSKVCGVYEACRVVSQQRVIVAYGFQCLNITVPAVMI